MILLLETCLYLFRVLWHVTKLKWHVYHSILSGTCHVSGIWIVPDTRDKKYLCTTGWPNLNLYSNSYLSVLSNISHQNGISVKNNTDPYLVMNYDEVYYFLSPGMAQSHQWWIWSSDLSQCVIISTPTTSHQKLRNQPLSRLILNM